MRIKNTRVTVNTKFTVKDNRLFRLSVKKVKELKTAARQVQFMKSVEAMPPGKAKYMILLASVKVRIIKAKLGMRKAENDFLADSVAMQKAIKDNALGYFTVLFDGLTLWDSNNTLFSDALKAIKNGVKGAAGMKTKAKTALDTSLKLALAYVNKLCLARQDLAESIIGAALMKVINSGTRAVSEISVKLGKSAASIAVSCPRVKVDSNPVDATYQKGFSTDNGVTWSETVSIPQCKYTFLGLEVGKPHIFRSRTVSAKTGTSVWVISRAITPI